MYFIDRRSNVTKFILIPEFDVLILGDLFKVHAYVWFRMITKQCMLVYRFESGVHYACISDVYGLRVSSV